MKSTRQSDGAGSAQKDSDHQESKSSISPESIQRDSTNAWGEAQTRFFFDLTPDRVLEAVEASGLRCTGRCTALNSFENRVYEVELEEDEDTQADPRSASALFARRRVVKFYRPGRWSRDQILEEHEFLLDLLKAEIPVVAPLAFGEGARGSNAHVEGVSGSCAQVQGAAEPYTQAEGQHANSEGQTLHETKEGGIFYAVFPKVGGRAPDELTDDQLRRIGRLLGRIHAVGASKAARHRITLSPETYGRMNLKSLLDGKWIPLEFASRFERAVREICDLSEPLFAKLPASSVHRVHGDCHLGNLLWNQSGPFFLDFDDMVIGPEVQDVWLLVQGRDEDSLRQRAALLEGYEEMRPFDWSSLKLIEPLRALRFVHYSAWLARRWNDPAFPRAFPQFGSHQYWQDETEDLEEQLKIIQNLT